MNASALASFATLSISSIDGSMSVPSKPYMIFRFRERANNVGSLRQSVSVHPRPQKQTFRHNGSQNSPCETIEILRPNHRGLSSCTCSDRQNSKQVYSNNFSIHCKSRKRHTSFPSRYTLPADGSYKCCTSDMTELLPPPDCPTKAAIFPGGTLRDS